MEGDLKRLAILAQKATVKLSSGGLPTGVGPACLEGGVPFVGVHARHIMEIE
jgi:hypothetical protein